MSLEAQTLLTKVLSSKDKDVVPSAGDETFEKAVKLNAEDFGKFFEKRASSHSGFSASVVVVETGKP